MVEPQTLNQRNGIAQEFWQSNEEERRARRNHISKRRPYPKGHRAWWCTWQPKILYAFALKNHSIWRIIVSVWPLWALSTTMGYKICPKNIVMGHWKGKHVWQHKYNVRNEFHHNFVPILRPKGFVAGFSSLVHSKGLVSKAELIAMVTLTRRFYVESF